MNRLIVGLPYRGLVQQCLKKVKYKNSWEVIDFLFELGSFEKVEGIMISVPMYGQKERERGFNQAERIAELLAKDCKVRNFVTHVTH
jgi:predicted amidophosphoribosyltransferase